MRNDERVSAYGWDTLRAAVARLLAPAGPQVTLAGAGLLLSESTTIPDGPLGGPIGGPIGGASGGGPRDDGFGDAQHATSSEVSEAERGRLIALVDLARSGDAEAFGLLYDHYQPSVYRFLYYRTRSVSVAEDLTSETFVRALRKMTSFRWQGKDFGAWLMTIARNLATDHFKSGRSRLELTTDDMGAHDDETVGPESLVMTSLTNEMLADALGRLPVEQRECLTMRFLQSMSIAETAAVLGRSDGAVKQLQLRGVRNLAKLMPEGIRY